MTTRARRGWRWSRTTAIQLVSAALVLGGVTVVAIQATGATDITVHSDPPAPPALVAALGHAEKDLFDRSGGQCVVASDLEAAIRQTFVDLDLTQTWSILRSAGVTSGGCVSYATSAPRRLVILVAAISTKVKDDLTSVAEQSYASCWSRDEAIASVTTVLEADGLTGWSIRTDGPVAAPLDRVEAVTAHVRSGCFIYSGTGWDNDGRRLFYVVGPP